jgi:Rod binding domain-containing protein
MTNVSGILNSTLLAPGQSREVKLTRAGRQFETVLLNSVFGALEHSFSSLGKEKTESASDRYHFLGMQALASNVAAHGGLGIADSIVRSVLKAESRQHPLSTEAKSLSKAPALERLFQRADAISDR